MFLFPAVDQLAYEWKHRAYRRPVQTAEKDLDSTKERLQIFEKLKDEAPDIYKNLDRMSNMPMTECSRRWAANIAG